MRGPYKVVKILPSGRYELRLLSGAYGKTTQAAAQHVAWRGEWCPETCAAFFENTETEEPETTPSTSAGLSMPSLDPEEEDAPAADVAGPSNASQGDSVEGDTRSGEAV